MSTSSTTNAIFTGTSQFSSDFQQVISRAVSMASLPMQQTQNDVNGLQTQSTELNTLSSRFTAVQSALTALDSAIGAGSYTASVGDKTIATATLSGTASSGTYSIEVDNTGSFATSMSSDGLATVSAPTSGSLSDATSYQLSVGGATTTITPAANTLSALASAINLSGANVQATIVNIGSGAAPDYRLALQGTQLGDQPIQLTSLNGSNPNQTLLTAGPAGTPAVYKVDGQPPNGIQSNTSTVTISPGVSVQLVGTGTTTVTVSQSMAGVSNALTNLVNAYNAAQAEVQKNRGQGTGGLNGQSVVAMLSNSLEQMLQYTNGTSGISSLAALGITSDQNGVLSFDPTVLASATSGGNLSSLTNFLGSAATGGFLKTASDAINGLTDSTSGVIATDRNSIQNQITADNNKISDDQNKINQMQTNLQSQMASADAAIAEMEQQYLYMSNMFAAQQQYSRNA